MDECVSVVFSLNQTLCIAVIDQTNAKVQGRSLVQSSGESPGCKSKNELTKPRSKELDSLDLVVRE